MARDIASVADKDTPEDAETRGEPVVPLPDGPRSEGGPVRRAPDLAEDADTAPLPAARTAPATDAEPSAFDLPVILEPLPEPAESLPQPLPDAAGIESETDAEADAPWHAALADALAEPATDLAPEPQEAPPVEPAISRASEPEAAPEPVPEPEPSEPPREAAPPAIGTPPPHGATAPPEPDPASFTTAATDLFHPPALGPGEEPHLITLGRRLDPARVIPRPEPPVITPRQEAEPEPAQPPADVWKARLLTAARYAALAAAGYLALVLVLIMLFRFVNPPGSMLMLTKLLGGTAIDRTWVPLASISPALVRAVIVSEDTRFCAHSGIDTGAMREAIEQAARGTPRGASTISMQVTKNLFLWSSKSYVRKVIEIPLTLVMELVWPKRRIIEVYLNIAEWGPGVFGAEAAARHHFRKSAAKLSEREAALLAAALPNPMVRVAGSPGPRTSAKARVIQSRVKAFGSVASCVVAPPPAPAAKSPAVRRTPLKAPARPVPRKKTPSDDWAPTLQFGP